MIKSLNLNLIKKLRVIIAPAKTFTCYYFSETPFYSTREYQRIPELNCPPSLLFFDIATKIRMIYMYIYRDEKMDDELILWIL